MDKLDCISLGGCTPPCEVKDMDAAFLEKLLFAQKMCGKKFLINSAYRSLAHEKKMGRNGRSSHCKGLAVDIATGTHDQRLYIVASLLLAGFRRIGVARTFIHVDDDPDKVTSMWLYYPEDVNKTF